MATLTKRFPEPVPLLYSGHRLFYTAYRLSVFPPPPVTFASRMFRGIDAALAREFNRGDKIAYSSMAGSISPILAIQRVICDLLNTPYVDVAGARKLARSHDELTAAEVDFRIAEAHGPVREILRAEELEACVGSITWHGTLAALIPKSSPPAQDVQKSPAN